MPRPFLASLATALLLAGCDAASEAPVAAPEAAVPVQSAGKLDRSHAGEPAPDLAFEDPDGAPVRLAEFGGKPLLVNLWATWCAPCIAEMPTLEALAEQRPELQVLAVSQDMAGRDKVESFLDGQGFEALRAYLDSSMGLMGALEVQSLPTTILYDSSGREVWRLTGIEDWTGQRAASLLAEAK